MKIRKAIFPVGGLGTRFLPATKALPKEMLPIVDKPLIQYAVEEAAAAGESNAAAQGHTGIAAMIEKAEEEAAARSKDGGESAAE